MTTEVKESFDDGTLANMSHRYTLPVADDGEGASAIATDVRGTLVYLVIGATDIELSDTPGTTYAVDYAVGRIVDPAEFPSGAEDALAVGDLVTVISSIILCKHEDRDWAFA